MITPPPGMIPRIPAKTGRRMHFGKMFLWRLQMGLSQSAVILDTVFDSISPEQHGFYASMSELIALTAGTIKSKCTLLAARDELARRGLIIIVQQSGETTGSRPTMYWRFMPDWVDYRENFSSKIEKVEKIYTGGGPIFEPPIREEIEKNSSFHKQIRIDKRRGEAEASATPAISDVRRISLERRITELRCDIIKMIKRNNQERATILHAELVKHQSDLGFTPDTPPIFRSSKPIPHQEENPLNPDEGNHEETRMRARKMVQELKTKLGRG
jgi:hypothetical protein